MLRRREWVGEVDLAGVEFRFDFAGRFDHVLHLTVGDLPGEEFQAAVGRDSQLLRRDDLQALQNVLLDLLDGLDFGGGELTEAETSKLESMKRSPDDDYGWWHLGAGTYLVEYNESLSGGDPVYLQPRTALVERGATHPTMSVSDLPRIPLSVPPAELQLKENARVSTLQPLD